MRSCGVIRTLLRVTSEQTRFHPVAVDGILAFATALAFLGAAASSPEEADRSADLISVAFAGLLGGALMFRRRWPLGVFISSLAMITIYMALDYPAVGLAFPLAASLYTAAVYGRSIPAALAAAVSLLTGLVWRVVVEPEMPLLVAVNMAQEGVGLAAALFLGETVRSRRALARETEARLQLLEAEQTLEAERRVIDERMVIARDLHDVVAHTVAVIGVQANLASDIFEDSPDEARVALGSIKSATKEAMSELRSAVDVMRQGESAPLMPAQGLDGLPDLVANAQRPGLEVDLQLEGNGEVPTMVGVTAYRVVQEAVTNVIRHSRADRVEITVERGPGKLRIRVVDNGTGADAISSSGHGISGMIERVGSLGGSLTAGNRGEGGFEVVAEIPVGGQG
jgi:signal transduction histidine kinase